MRATTQSVHILERRPKMSNTVVNLVIKPQTTGKKVIINTGTRGNYFRFRKISQDNFPDDYTELRACPSYRKTHVNITLVAGDSSAYVSLELQYFKAFADGCNTIIQQLESKQTERKEAENGENNI
jgi:hypothetical protein